MSHVEKLTAYIGSFVDELTRSGVKNAVISPGSRSTPIAMLMADHPDLKAWINVDERSAGFFALGMAKAENEPVALLCTSGTAAANYYPAVVEAQMARVPLIVITADRPHELRDVGAPQAIDQIGMFGKYPKWSMEMALPEESDSMIHYVRTVAGRAVSVSKNSPSGPVHLNFPLREPLIPDLDRPSLWENGRSDNRQWVRTTEMSYTLPDGEVERIAMELSGKRGVIVCGAQDNNGFPEAVTNLAEKLKFPILADPLSQLRSGKHSKDRVIDGYDAFLRNEQAVSALKPDVIVRFGAMPVSKAFLLYLKKHQETRLLVIDEGGGWREPTHQAEEMIYADPVAFCNRVISSLSFMVNENAEWEKKWIRLNNIVTSRLHDSAKADLLFEGRVFKELEEQLPDNSLLFVGNSMPVRDLDSFFHNNEKKIRTMANRGANGIDGVVSTALGTSASQAQVVLVIGDLSFFHDLNGLAAAKLHGLNITIIVINNDGGGIFSFLPQGKQQHEKHFEALFGTPLGLDYKNAVEMYGGRFTRISNWGEFQNAFENSGKSKGLHVIEVPADRTENVNLHREIREIISEDIAVFLSEEQ
ncbi:2-succinyl-5-enolpyruvyl-6-hydroxy-3-cyclohexene-1-carboxylic-acid synthase [Pseudalkalibacillus caeni]|uniref:2-succinyl-5-enolpyruvyl-6-hydroxy-3-cyclohexene-1-carboxylate synthase n=1 Tax=Exobacillus caeni TaxID=2574798 RepID=A0A5R9FHF9_9BACL|nr:2-succinyl-5-enolpyruvyl-6-hydroxy-3-cyclohexene-1-carboxylic-acid synthase [Pseudalkalibacillus caeni]TLS39005.1 2-succinyl-5-enolpyruvyl-6-hydroxy-3-cyclohexene-1-carboxylic-acid synthase [Pseudalkalibacillus caeni]